MTLSFSTQNTRSLFSLSNVLLFLLKFSFYSLDRLDWVCVKPSLHFGEDKPKSIFFTSKWRSKNVRQFNITCNQINIKQHSQVISWVRVRRENVLWTNGTDVYQQYKCEIKTSLQEKLIFHKRSWHNLLQGSYSARLWLCVSSMVF